MIIEERLSERYLCYHPNQLGVSGPGHFSRLGSPCEKKFSPETVVSTENTEGKRGGEEEKGRRPDRFPVVQSQKD